MLATGDLVVCRIEAVPACAGDVDLGPSVSCTVLSFSHLDISGDESRREPPMPNGFHHEHCEVAARSTAMHQCLVRQLDSGLFAVGILKGFIDVSVQFAQEIKSADNLSGAVEIV